MPFVKGRAIVRDKDQQKVRDLLILKRRIETNASTTVLGKEFNLDPKTISRALTRVCRGDLAQQFEAELFKDLVPLAMHAVKEALIRGDHQVALDILKGTNVLQKPGSAPPVDTGDGDELEVHIRAKRKRSALNGQFAPSDVSATKLLDLPEDPDSVPSDPEAADGEVVGDRHPAPTEGPESLRPDHTQYESPGDPDGDDE